MRLVILGLGLAFIAGPALADDAPRGKPAAKAEDPNEVVCKERLRANSRFKARMCLTRADWEARTDTAVQAFSEVQNRPQAVLYPPNGAESDISAQFGRR